MYTALTEWEDVVIFDTLEAALEASLKYKDRKLEIFQILEEGGGFEPTYAFIKNGKLDITNKLEEVVLDEGLMRLI